MNTLRGMARFLALPLAVTLMLSSGLSSVARAAMVPSDRIIERAAAEAERERREAARERVAAFVAREDVRQEMTQLGVDPDEAAARVAGLSDAEVARVAGELDRLPAGQGAVGAVVGAFVLLFLVLLITDLLCLTHFFPFTRCAR